MAPAPEFSGIHFIPAPERTEVPSAYLPTQFLLAAVSQGPELSKVSPEGGKGARPTSRTGILMKFEPSVWP